MPPQLKHQSTQNLRRAALKAADEVPTFIQTEGDERLSQGGGGQALWVVVKGNIPPALLDGLKRDFNEAEFERIYARIHKTLAPANSQPIALFIFGPSAVGKTVISDLKATELFGSPENAVDVDGAHFRAEHAGWQAVLHHGISSGVLHEEAWGCFKKLKISTKLKTRVINEAVAARQHMIIPDTLNDPPKVEKLIEQLLAEQYVLHAVCLWAPLSVTRRRGEPRSVREGKVWSGGDYPISTSATLQLAAKFAQQMRANPDGFRSVSMWDNTTFPAIQCSLEEFSRLQRLDFEAAERHYQQRVEQQRRHVEETLACGESTLANKLLEIMSQRDADPNGVDPSSPNTRGPRQNDASAPNSTSFGRYESTPPAPSASAASNLGKRRNVLASLSTGARRRYRLQGAGVGLAIGLAIGALVLALVVVALRADCTWRCEQSVVPCP